MQKGIELHEELEGYLRTGNKANLSSLALAGLHMLPPAVNGLLVEHSIVPTNPQTGVEDLALAPLRLSGVPVLGKIDLLHGLGINYGTQDIEEINDPPGTVEADDHKRVNDTKYCKTPNELVDTLQMAIYGKYAFEMAPGAEFVRLAHLYYPAKSGSPRKVSILATREMIEPAWKRAGSVAVSVIDAAKETNPDNVEANTRACRAYGRDCSARSVCRASQHNSLSSFIGTTAADRMLAGATAILGDPLNMTTPPVPAPSLIQPGSLLAHLRATQGAPTAPAPIQALVPPAPPAPIAAPTIPAPVVDAASELARLTAQLATAPLEGPDLVAIVTEIHALGLGFPQTHGAAAAAIAELAGATIASGAGLAGAGELGELVVDDTSKLREILTYAQAIVAQRAAGGGTVTVAAPAFVKAEVAPPVEKEKKTRAPRKTKEAPPPPPPPPHTETVTLPTVTIQPVVQVAPMPEPAPPAVVAAPAADRVYFYADCAPEGIASQSFWPVVYHVTSELSKTAGENYRASAKLDYGKWKGAVMAALQQIAPTIPAGHYTLPDAGTELGQVVVETMREQLAASGGVLVRGTR